MFSVVSIVIEYHLTGLVQYWRFWRYAIEPAALSHIYLIGSDGEVRFHLTFGPLSASSLWLLGPDSPLHNDHHVVDSRSHSGTILLSLAGVEGGT